MLQIAWFATRLFFKGRLLRDPMNFVKLVVIGTISGLGIFLSLNQLGTPLGLNVTTSSLLIGMIMPYIFRDFKMK
ncbi:hypothetical protein [Calothrix sp. PCC 6303]|uniref:hypothetical protein n=1 Tax=Calothrix sp. PCC 6303 TaxID=1170562 RepID=UPI0002A01EAC|nr:hypothetical protein [Calothrix sp. PCC 6303]AFY99572.1 hypothetical protein Cal6303_0497 [Calothrix sp. PCC 6303]